MEEYSITETHETGSVNVFWQQFKASLIKKLKMQFRQPRTLMIEMFFPIVLIVAGLALSKIAVIKTGVPREMSPSIFP